jgi:hypothetical protein
MEALDQAARAGRVTLRFAGGRSGRGHFAVLFGENARRNDMGDGRS